MSLWNLIRDWFVQYIWGGVDSFDNTYGNNNIGYVFSSTDEITQNTNVSSFFIPLVKSYEDNMGVYVDYICLGDWLSTTSTIIVLILTVVCLGYLIVNLFKMFSNIFSLKR